VIEAPQKSGSLITARVANEYGREVYALPGTLDNPKAAGCLNLLSQGAQLILGEAELLKMLGTLPPLINPPVPEQLSLLTGPVIQPEPANLAPALKQVLHTIGLEPIAFDLIVQKADLATSEVLSALVQLELMGLVSQLPGMRYQRG
jgi:DNA processing protein